MRSRCREVARNAMIIREFRPTLCGKQSDEKPDTSLLCNVPSELHPLGSNRLFLASSDVRHGSEAEESSCGAGLRSAPAAWSASTGIRDQRRRRPQAAIAKPDPQEKCLALVRIGTRKHRSAGSPALLGAPISARTGGASPILGRRTLQAWPTINPAKPPRRYWPGPTGRSTRRKARAAIDA